MVCNFRSLLPLGPFFIDALMIVKFQPRIHFEISFHLLPPKHMTVLPGGWMQERRSLHALSPLLLPPLSPPPQEADGQAPEAAAAGCPSAAAAPGPDDAVAPHRHLLPTCRRPSARPDCCAIGGRWGGPPSPPPGPACLIPFFRCPFFKRI